jgi:hypothetical protein
MRLFYFIFISYAECGMLCCVSDPYTYTRLNSWMKSRQKSEEFSSLLFSRLYSFALRFLFLETHTTSYSFYSSVTVQCK